MNDLRDVFFEEAVELLTEMEAGLLRLEESASDPDLINAVFRCAHSIKGGSGTVGLGAITEFTHSMESLLDLMREGRIQPTPALADLLLRSTDELKAMLACARTGDARNWPEGLIRELNRAIATADSADSVPAAAALREKRYRIYFAPSADCFSQRLNPILAINELKSKGTLIEASVDLPRLPALSDLDPERCYLGWNLLLASELSEAELRDVVAFYEEPGAQIVITLISDPEQPQSERVEAPLSDEPAQAAPTGARARNPETASIRVSTEKVDKLIDLVGELVIAQSMATEIIIHFSPERLGQLHEAMAQIERNTREVQERVMAVRMMPIGSIFSRFPRLVRDLAASTGKQIQLQMFGEETELDKSMVERIADPLMHLVRNSADHGLEPPEERQQAGKYETGVIRLLAYHQGGSIIIEVSDDGRGLNTERIRQKAIERGLIRPEDPSSEEHIHNMIFHPGFSTAEKVSDVSGRGVGMDVVKKNIESLNGTISLVSTPGKGTTTRIKLPITLAILDGLSLRVGREVFILPLMTIVESIQPRPESIKTIIGRGEVMVVRGDPLPVLRLHQIFGIHTEITDPCKGLIVIVEHEGERLALLVDELLGQQQVVIKSLETHFRKVDGVLGATILGDGRAALILDVSGIVALSRNGAGGVFVAA